MMLNLKVEIPFSADRDQALAALTLAQLKGEGITLVTPRRAYLDVDLVNVELADAELATVAIEGRRNDVSLS